MERLRHHCRQETVQVICSGGIHGGADAVEHLVNFAKSENLEMTMLDRACGKNSLTNTEPEDLRVLTVAGKEYNFRVGR